jgi:hypothetical protein
MGDLEAAASGNPAKSQNGWYAGGRLPPTTGVTCVDVGCQGRMCESGEVGGVGHRDDDRAPARSELGTLVKGGR